jgi:hypothetical protein
MTTRIYAAGLMGFDDDENLPVRTAWQLAEREACANSFPYFLKYWRFRNRETGQIDTFRELWEGQLDFVVKMLEHRWIFALKAGKLGFTEVECAHDAWVALFGQPNARIHLFSLDAPAARSLLKYIRFGITHLPEWLGLPVLADEPGGDTMTSIILDGGLDDARTIVSYAAGPHVSIDQSATHVHVDELARMPHPEDTWSAIQSTVAPVGSCHIVTRGNDSDYIALLWEAAESRIGQLIPFFAPYSARPRPPTWKAEQAGTMSMQQLMHLAPETVAEALAGDETSEYIAAATWDACYDPHLPPLLPGSREDVVLGVDAAVTGDSFAVVAVTRHPRRRDEAAIRCFKVWRPGDHGGRIDFDEVERFLRWIMEGGCPGKHPRSMPHPSCGHCSRGEFTVEKYHVVQLTYDPYQMESMAQRLRGLTWLWPFPQGREREIADSAMHKYALRGQISHPAFPEIREHILNARAKLSKESDSRMRMVKRSPSRKIDLAVAASMAIDRCLYLLLD